MPAEGPAFVAVSLDRLVGYAGIDSHGSPAEIVRLARCSGDHSNASWAGLQLDSEIDFSYSQGIPSYEPAPGGSDDDYEARASSKCEPAWQRVIG